MPKFQSFDTLEDLFSVLDEDRRIANTQTQEWQKALKVGDHFLKEYEGLAIWGVIEQDYEEEGEELVVCAHDPYYPITNCFSSRCPQGELGYSHASTIVMKITESQFETLKVKCPVEFTEALEITNLYP